MSLGSRSEVDDALQRVGELLAAGGHEYAIVILGGAALNLLGIVQRPTTDVDILAFARPGGDRPRDLQEPPEPMPEPLLRAARIVGRDLDLGDGWLNTDAALQWRVGLPPGVARRVRWRGYAALRVGVVDRYDLIFFKLFAAADSGSSGSVHYRDLLAIEPTANELDAAAAWVATQDASPEFPHILEQVVTSVRRDLNL